MRCVCVTEPSLIFGIEHTFQLHPQDGNRKRHKYMMHSCNHCISLSTGPNRHHWTLHKKGKNKISKTTNGTTKKVSYRLFMEAKKRNSSLHTADSLPLSHLNMDMCMYFSICSSANINLRLKNVVIGEQICTSPQRTLFKVSGVLLSA